MSVTGAHSDSDHLLVTELELATIPMQGMQGGEAGKIGLLGTKLATLPCMDDRVVVGGGGILLALEQN